MAQPRRIGKFFSRVRTFFKEQDFVEASLPEAQEFGADVAKAVISMALKDGMSDRERWDQVIELATERGDSILEFNEDKRLGKVFETLDDKAIAFLLMIAVESAYYGRKLTIESVKSAAKEII